MTQNNLGIAYWNRIAGDRAESLELAIASYQLALQVSTKETFPIDWAATVKGMTAEEIGELVADGETVIIEWFVTGEKLVAFVVFEDSSLAGQQSPDLSLAAQQSPDLSLRAQRRGKRQEARGEEINRFIAASLRTAVSDRFW